MLSFNVGLALHFLRDDLVIWVIQYPTCPNSESFFKGVVKLK